MTREEICKEFYIEDHAVLYGLMLKQAEALCGQSAKDSSELGTRLYARERGLRMAMRAMRDNEPLTPNNYMAYGEWVDYKGVGKQEVISFQPEFLVNTVKCGWHETWKKYGFLEYGKVYCDWVDKELVHGFNPENSLELSSFLTYGHHSCNFKWDGVIYHSEDDLKANMEKKNKLSPSTAKDFLYHTAHLYSALKRGYLYGVGLVKANEIACNALEEYAKIFGKDKAEAILEEANQDFLTI